VRVADMNIGGEGTIGVGARQARMVVEVEVRLEFGKSNCSPARPANHMTRFVTRVPVLRPFPTLHAPHYDDDDDYDYDVVMHSIAFSCYEIFLLEYFF
jgi:hypothetical protein